MLWLAGLLSGPAAALTPPLPPYTLADDIERARGCWIERVEPDGRATRLLRLLPEHERRDRLSGQVQRADGDDPDRRPRLWFSRDGAQAWIGTTAPRASAEPPAPAFVRIPGPSSQPPAARSGLSAFDYAAPDGRRRLRVEYNGESLRLSRTALAPGGRWRTAEVLFDGQRDGCD